MPQKKLKDFFIHNWKIKLISFIITLMFWYFANQQ